MPFLIIYVTHPDETTAKDISDMLLTKKLVACANIFPIKSAYWWDAAIQHENEYVSILKTSAEKWTAVKTEIESLHPYQTPCIVRWEASANEKYENWIHESVNP